MNETGPALLQTQQGEIPGLPQRSSESVKSRKRHIANQGNQIMKHHHHRGDRLRRQHASHRGSMSSRGQNRRRILELLARNRDGMTESLLASSGLVVPDVVALVRAGLANVSRDGIVMKSETIEVARARITDAGRRALANDPGGG
jgi:hypothetical protein